MLGTVEVVSQSEFQSWLDEQQGGASSMNQTGS
jgi:heme/copper-type cytochrome/quinol oxidase subunit 2